MSLITAEEVSNIIEIYKSGSEEHIGTKAYDDVVDLVETRLLEREAEKKFFKYCKDNEIEHMKESKETCKDWFVAGWVDLAKNVKLIG